MDIKTLFYSPCLCFFLGLCSFAKIQSLLGKIKINFCCFSHNNINEIFVWDRFTLPSKRRGSMDIEPESRRSKKIQTRLQTFLFVIKRHTSLVDQT